MLSPAGRDLPAAMKTALAAALGPVEKVRFAWHGPSTFIPSARHWVVVTDLQAFGWKNGRMRTYQFGDLWDVQWGTGRYPWIHFRGPGLDGTPPKAGNFGAHSDAYQLDKVPPDAQRSYVERALAAERLRTQKTVELPCPACGQMGPFAESGPTAACSACSASFVFYECARCQGVNQGPTVAPRGDWVCEFCFASISLRKPGGPLRTAADRREELAKREMLAPRHEVVLVGGFRVVGGGRPGSPPLPTDSIVSLQCSPDAVHIRPEYGASTGWDLPYAAITTIDLDGKVTTTGGGFIGGGFGLKGAIEGMAISAVLNALTTGTVVDTRLRIGMTDGELLLRHDRVPQDALRAVLSPLWTRSEAVRHRVPATAPTGYAVTELIAQLGQLHDSGVLTDDEFAAKKAELLSRI